MKTKGNTQRIRARRETAKNYLIEQLKRGTKPEKINGKTINKTIPLTDSDKIRINREIEAINNPKGKQINI